ncbi:MAG: hypothetical protein E7575_06345 [Ruminococcaceae bacterium]|nr:hypothetical protein [Oscillospiraceae bacterium]
MYNYWYRCIICDNCYRKLLQYSPGRSHRRCSYFG